MNGIPQSKEEYDALILPDETERRRRLIEQGMMNAKQNSLKKTRMLERLATKKKRIELAERYGV